MEDYARALNGNYLLARLTKRYGDACLPRVMTVDMTDRTLLDRWLALSRPLTEEIGKNLVEAAQYIVDNHVMIPGSENLDLWKGEKGGCPHCHGNNF